jgi:hypothetical protein
MSWQRGRYGLKDETYREEGCGFAHRLMPVAFDYKSIPHLEVT